MNLSQNQIQGILIKRIEHNLRKHGSYRMSQNDRFCLQLCHTVTESETIRQQSVHHHKIHPLVHSPRKTNSPHLHLIIALHKGSYQQHLLLRLLLLPVPWPGQWHSPVRQRISTGLFSLCSLYFEMQSQLFANDRARVAFVISLLTH